MNEQQFCSSCGKPTPGDASFCPACGSQLHAPRSTGATQDARLEQPARTTSVFVLGLLSILSIAPLGIVGWILSGKGSQQVRSGRAKPNAMFTTGKVMSIIGTALTCVLVVFWAVVLGSHLVRSASSRRGVHEDFSAREAPQNLPVMPVPGSGPATTPVQAPPLPPDLARVSIDGAWNVNIISEDWPAGVSCWDIVGYANGDLNVTLKYPPEGIEVSITGRRQGERILITVTYRGTPGSNFQELHHDPVELHYDLKLVSPTSLTGSVEFADKKRVVNGVKVK